MLNSGMSPWPSFSEEEAEAVKQVILSNKVNYWTGNVCREFEREFATYCGTKHAIALSNGTLALELALRAVGIGAGDEVIVTPRTFLASASSIVTVGGSPVFADVDLDSQNITAESIRKVISPKTKAILCVHLAGWPCEMDEINQLAREHGVKVIEDCAQAHGAKYRGASVGSLSDVAAWSFCQDKIMTTGGEGGMVTTNNTDFWNSMWSYKDHGKSWEAVYERQHPPGFRWLHESFGSNWRMLEVQAAIGRIQLKRMNQWTTVRQQYARQIDQVAREFDCVRTPVVPSHIEHARYKHYLFVRPDRLKSGWDRDQIVRSLNERGVPAQFGSCSEVYLEKAFDNTPWRPEQRLPNAKLLGETSIMFMVHPTLKTTEMDRACEALKTVLSQASR